MLHGLISKQDIGLCMRSGLAPIPSAVDIIKLVFPTDGLGLRRCKVEETYSEGLY